MNYFFFLMFSSDSLFPREYIGEIEMVKGDRFLLLK